MTLTNIVPLRISDEQLADMERVREKMAEKEQKPHSRLAAIRYCLELGRQQALAELELPPLPGLPISRQFTTKKEIAALASQLVLLGYESLSPTQPSHT